MSDQSSIEWTATRHEDGTVTKGSTWNPIRGQNARHTCARISPGCDNCYAATMTRRGLMGTAPIDYGKGETLNDPARLDEKALLQPLSWKKPRKIFVCSMTDLFGTWVPDEWIDKIMAIMAICQQHTFIVLTKRPTRMRDYLLGCQAGGQLKSGLSLAVQTVLDHTYTGRSLMEPLYRLGLAFQGWPWPLSNVWIGVTIESDEFSWRADRLRQTPAAVRWVSAEPLLSGLPSLNLDGIDWLVTGGESGAKARPMHPLWVPEIRDRCLEAGVAFFHKQNGEWLPTRPSDPKPDGNVKCHEWNGGMTAWRVGNYRSGRLLDGRTWDEYPTPILPDRRNETGEEMVAIAN